jgi:ABC-type phosphate/phosphonate transport system substrate-binding protein
VRARSFLSVAALPHYDAVAAHVAVSLGVAAPRVEQTGLTALATVVAQPEPTLAFLCGLPFVRLRAAGAAVEAIAAPVALTAAGPVYYTDLVTRGGDDRPLTALRLGYNDADSLSGWVLPCAAMRAAGHDPDALDWHRTGSHLASLERIRAGDLDAAPVDSTVLDLARRTMPAARGLQVRARYGPMPAPPVVSWGGGEAFTRAVRAALLTLHHDDAGRRALALGGVARFAAVTPAAYCPVRSLDLRRPASTSR